jgi:hypothetical protein
MLEVRNLLCKVCCRPLVRIGAQLLPPHRKSVVDLPNRRLRPVLNLILRRIALIWTFMVASVISIFRAMHLLESPSIRQRTIDFSCWAIRSSGASIVVSLSLRDSAFASRRCVCFDRE